MFEICGKVSRQGDETPQLWRVHRLPANQKMPQVPLERTIGHGPQKDVIDVQPITRQPPGHAETFDPFFDSD